MTIPQSMSRQEEILMWRCTSGKGMRLTSNSPGIEAWFCHLLSGSPCVNYIIFLSPRFLICKLIRIMTMMTKDCWVLNTIGHGVRLATGPVQMQPGHCKWHLLFLAGLKKDIETDWTTSCVKGKLCLAHYHITTQHRKLTNASWMSEIVKNCCLNSMPPCFQ